MKSFVETYKRLYKYSIAINIRLWVGTLYLSLKGDLGIARREVSRHFIVVNLYISIRFLYKNKEDEIDE